MYNLQFVLPTNAVRSLYVAFEGLCDSSIISHSDGRTGSGSQ